METTVKCLEEKISKERILEKLAKNEQFSFLVQNRENTDWVDCFSIHPQSKTCFRSYKKQLPSGKVLTIERAFKYKKAIVQELEEEMNVAFVLDCAKKTNEVIFNMYISGKIIKVR